MAGIISPAGNAITLGTPTVFKAARTYHISVTSLSHTKALVTYQDAGNSYYDTACVLNISGNTITTGAPTVFNTASTYFTSVIALSSTQALVTYNTRGYGTACVLDISGNTITTGNSAVFNTATTQYILVIVLSSTQALVTYRDAGNSYYGTACVLDISGNTITPGIPVVFNEARTDYISVTALSSTQVLVTYTDAGNSNYGTACVLDISGNTITPGIPVVFNTASTGYISVTALSPDKALATYADSVNSNYGTACVLDISGSTITPGTSAVFNTASTSYTSVIVLSSTQALVTYRGNRSHGTACVLDISGNTITPSTPKVFNAKNTFYISVTALSSTRALVTYRGNSSYGTACILDIEGEA